MAALNVWSCTCTRLFCFFISQVPESWTGASEWGYVTMVTVLLQSLSLLAGSYFQMAPTIQVSQLVTGGWIFMPGGEARRTVLSSEGCALIPTFTTRLLSLVATRMHVQRITVWMYTPSTAKTMKPNQCPLNQVQLKHFICQEFRWAVCSILCTWLDYWRSGNFCIKNNSCEKIFMVLNFRSFTRSANFFNGWRLRCGWVPGEFLCLL